MSTFCLHRKKKKEKKKEKESQLAMMREELDFNEKRDDRTRERKGWVSFQISF